tara:strand:- start:143 stop:505 length:363 start_codon:yes stop_codon:yes gene_type:complete
MEYSPYIFICIEGGVILLSSVLLEACAGPMKKLIVNPANQNNVISLVINIALPKTISPKREVMTVIFEPNLSSIHPNKKAPNPAEIFMKIPKTSISLKSKPNVPAAYIPPNWNKINNPSA